MHDGDTSAAVRRVCECHSLSNIRIEFLLYYYGEISLLIRDLTLRGEFTVASTIK